VVTKKAETPSAYFFINFGFAAVEKENIFFDIEKQDCKFPPRLKNFILNVWVT